MTKRNGLDSPYLGGPLGLAGLAVMATAGGALAVVGLSPDTGAAPEPETASPAARAEPPAERPPPVRDAGAEEPTFQTAQAPAEPIDFIVRVEGAPDVEKALGAFRTDPNEARAAFDRWAADKPNMKMLRLTGVTYSGELILTYDPKAADRRRSVGQVRELLNKTPGVRYADPDYRAHPGDTPK